ncbi:MAG: selenocysteine-specific translation elongation factor [Pirellulales bacterium]
MTRRTVILGTAGHIDHGKTTLIRALTGIDTDRLPEEKQRGITIDIGFANLEVGPFQLGIVDVPGHERFIKNMLAGAAGIDVALLVVAADDSVMPQTREHLAILQLLGIQHGVVVITKCDRVEPSWLDLVEEDIRSLVRGTFLEGSPIVRTVVVNESAPTGLQDLRDAIELVCDKLAETSATGVFRMPIDRAFSLQGLGTVVTGTVWAGQLRVRDEVDWMPLCKKLTVRSLQSHGRDTDFVVRGQRAAVNVLGAHHSEITRGHEIATPGFLAPSRLLTVDLQVLGDSPRGIKHRSRQRLHLGTQEVIVQVALLGFKSIEPGQTGVAQLYCAEPAIAVAGQQFVMRAESPLITIGGGRVLQPNASRIARRHFGRIEGLKQLRAGEDATRASAALSFYGTRPWTRLELCRDANLRIEQVDATLGHLEQSGEIVSLLLRPRRTLLVHRDVLAEIEQGIVDAVKYSHARAPLRPTVSRERIVQLFKRRQESNVLEAIIDRLIERGALRGDQRSVALPDFAPQLSTTQQRLHEHVLTAFLEAGVKPPTPIEISNTMSSTEETVLQILDLCAAEGALVYIGGEIYLHRDVEAGIRLQVERALNEGAGLTVSQIRDLIGTSRKFAVPICEHFDRIGLTRRAGDLRVLH